MAFNPDILKSAGWYLYSTCNCNGIRKDQYRHKSKPGYEFIVNPNHDNFLFTINSKKQLQGKLNQIAQKVHELEIQKSI